jgi:hypothetical protein
MRQSLQSLLRSSSIFNAFVNPTELQHLSLISVLLICVWSLSAIGGQASLRIIYKSNHASVDSVPLRYMDTGPAGLVYTGENILIALDGELSPTIPTSYDAALMQSLQAKLVPEDSWGNVKIPRIESLDSSTADPDNWIPFSGGTVESYSPLIGLPIVGLPDTGLANFTVESSYVTLSCLPLGVVSDTSILNESVAITSSTTFIIFFPQSMEISNETESGLDEALTTDRVRFLLGVNTTTAANTSELASRLIDFYSYSASNGANNYAHARCTLSQTHVETSVRCADGSCQPV